MIELVKNDCELVKLDSTISSVKEEGEGCNEFKFETMSVFLAPADCIAAAKASGAADPIMTDGAVKLKPGTLLVTSATAVFDTTLVTLEAAKGVKSSAIWVSGKTPFTFWPNVIPSVLTVAAEFLLIKSNCPFEKLEMLLFKIDFKELLRFIVSCAIIFSN